MARAVKDPTLGEWTKTSGTRPGHYAVRWRAQGHGVMDYVSTADGQMKKISDKVNAAFEFCGGFFILLNIIKLWNDKCVAGVDWRAVAFFTVWGYWNCFYYRNLGQRASHYCGIFIAVMNTVWLYLLIFYSFN